FPSCRGSQNGPHREGFASPRNTGAPLTAAGRSERTPPSKRERGRVKSNQTTAVLAPFSTAIDTHLAVFMALLAPRDILGGLQTGFSLPARRPGQYAYRHLRSKRANDSRPERVLPQTRRSEPDPLFPIPAAARIWGGLHAPRLSLGPSCRIEPSQWNTRICRPRRCRSGKCPLMSKPAEGLVQQPANQTCLGGWTEPDDQALPSSGASLRSRQRPFGYPGHARPRENTSNTSH